MIHAPYRSKADASAQWQALQDSIAANRAIGSHDRSTRVVIYLGAAGTVLVFLAGLSAIADARLFAWLIN